MTSSIVSPLAMTFRTSAWNLSENGGLSCLRISKPLTFRLLLSSNTPKYRFCTGICYYYYYCSWSGQMQPICKSLQRILQNLYSVLSFLLVSEAAVLVKQLLLLMVLTKPHMRTVTVQ